MNKLISLRDHLLAIPGEIKIEPDDLITYAKGGQVLSEPSGTNDHFEYKYKAEVIITNFSGKADQLTFWLLQWLKVEQPDHVLEAIQFEADILNDDSVDLSFIIDLSETVKVEQTEAGIVLHHVGEPSIEPEYLNAAEWTLFVNDDPVADWVENG